jgi:hypothetical protein
VTTPRAANEVILGWLNALANQDVCQVRLIAAKAVADLKSHLLAVPPHWSETELNQAFMAAVLLRSIYDCAFLVEETIRPGWVSDHDKVRAIWHRFCDCRERFGFAQGFCQGPFVDYVSRFLTETERIFLTNFGPGTYFSPTLLIDELICSICTRDLRGCEHLPGKLYGGKLCRGVARKCRFQENGNVGSLVTVPRDPRCRIWPWQANETESNILFLSTFIIDDFIERDDWQDRMGSCQEDVEWPAMQTHDAGEGPPCADFCRPGETGAIVWRAARGKAGGLPGAAEGAREKLKLGDWNNKTNCAIRRG